MVEKEPVFDDGLLNKIEGKLERTGRKVRVFNLLMILMLFSSYSSFFLWGTLHLYTETYEAILMFSVTVFAFLHVFLLYYASRIITRLYRRIKENRDRGQREHRYSYHDGDWNEIYGVEKENARVFYQSIISIVMLLAWLVFWILFDIDSIANRFSESISRVFNNEMAATIFPLIDGLVRIDLQKITNIVDAESAAVLVILLPALLFSIIIFQNIVYMLEKVERRQYESDIPVSIKSEIYRETKGAMGISILISKSLAIGKLSTVFRFFTLQAIMAIILTLMFLIPSWSFWSS